MKSQTIQIDFTAMLYTGIMYMGLVISGWLLLRLTIACFKLPSMLNAVATAESKNKTEQTSTTSHTALSEEENEDLQSSVQYFDTLMHGTCNDTSILKQSEGEKRGRKRNTGSRSNAISATYAEAELITKGLNNSDDVDGRRTTRSSTRGSTAASKLKNEPPAKKEKKTPAVKGKRGRPKAVSKDESEEAVSAEENGIADNDVDSKADKGGSSTEEEVDSKAEDKIENGNSSAEEEKKVEEKKESTGESDKPSVIEGKKDLSSP